MQPIPSWPALTRYDQDHLARIALPLGGIGTGTVSLGGCGNLQDWEIVNRPAKGFTPAGLHVANTFFALFAHAQGEAPVTRVLEGPLDPSTFEGWSGSPAQNHGLPRFRSCAFDAAYPLGQVHLADPDMPVRVTLQAFNPLIPGDSLRSGLPVAILRFVVVNERKTPVEISLCGSLKNFIGSDGSGGEPRQNKNVFRDTKAASGIFLCSDGVLPTDERWGTIALATLGKAGVTRRAGWANLSWGSSLLDFWDDFSADGRLEERDPAGDHAPVASLAVSQTLAPQEQASVTFLIAWHFPNRMTWTPQQPAPAGDDGACCAEGTCDSPENPNWIGNYYATRFRDAWQVAERTIEELPTLEADTLTFVRAVCDSDMPQVIKEAALSNLTGLRSQTFFRTADGRAYGWEGCMDRQGCCHGSCTHVWNYETATSFLFGDLARSQREVEFAHATADNGRMSFRVELPIERAREYPLAAADGQMGCLMKLYRDWQLSGDDALLASLWPWAKKALAFAWIENGWDADRDGVMEGCQHNTMDVEYYGPNPEIGTWYLGALRAGEEMAKHLGDDHFAGQCRDLFTRGSAWIDANLFNGEYYEHQIRPTSPDSIAPGLRHGTSGARDPSSPDLQLGAACLVDQLVGQYMAHICGLGYLLKAENVRATLQSLMRYNFQESLWAHFNPYRTYALQDEAGMVIATYPRGRRPDAPFPYFQEIWTGLEYVAAVGMLYERQTEDALRVMQATRNRYDGRRRSPFDEAECGHHYARAMASWSAIPAFTGFHYSAVEKTLRFRSAQAPCRWFWSNGAAWGTFAQRPKGKAIDLTLCVLYGSLAVKALVLEGAGQVDLPAARTLAPGETLSLSVPASG